MTPPPADCPPADTLSRYLDDALSPTIVGPLTAHIDGCSACQAKLDEITSGLTERFKNLGSAVGRADTPPAKPNPATDTQVFGPDGIPLVPQVATLRPQIPGYEVDGEIGRGGMGVVFKATHKRLNRTVALKMVLAAGVADPRVTQRFLFEAEVLARVQHPQVVQVYEVNMYTSPAGVVFPYLAMEFLDGGTLVDWLGGAAIPPAEAADLIEGLARAVHAVHLQGIIHRDLKPANILRAADGQFKVSDFGLAKLTTESGAQLTGTGTIVGTPAYMAPEQAGGGKGVSPAADVYSLGAILFELLAGRPPFAGADPMSVLLQVIREAAPDVRSFRPDVPRDLSAVVMKCLTKEPGRRYQSADDLAADLGRFRNGRPTCARTHSAVERAWYWSRRNPAMATLLATLAVVLTAGFLSTLIMWRQAEGTAEDMRRASTRAELLAERAGKKSDEAETQRREADSRGAYLAFDQAVRWCESGQIDDGLRGFVHALDLAERTGDAELRRVIRTNIAAWERELYPAGRRFRLEGQPLTASAFSPDGKWVLAAGGDCRVRVWDADTGRRVAVLDMEDPLHALERIPGLKEIVRLRPVVRGVAADGGNKWVVASTSDGYLLVWSATDGKLAHRIPVVSANGRSGDLWAATFTADGRLWVGGDNGVLYGYDPATGRREAVFEPAGSANLSAVGAVFGGPAWVPSARPTGRLALPAPRGLSSYQSVRASIDGKYLYTGDRLGRLLEWDVSTGRATGLIQLSGWVADVAVSPDGRFVAGCATDGTARMWDRTAPAAPWVIDLGGAYGRTVALTHDGRRLAVGDEDGKVTLYDTTTRSAVGGPLRLGLNTQRIDVRARTNELLVPESDGVRVQPLLPTVGVPILPPPNSVHRVRILDFRPDGQALLIGSGGLRVHDPTDGKPLSPPLLTEEPLGGRFSEDGRRIVYGGRGYWGAVDTAGYTERFRWQAESQYLSLFPARPTASFVPLFLGHRLSLRTADTGGIVRLITPECLARTESRPAAAITSPDGGEVWIAILNTVEFAHSTTGKSVRPPIRTAGEVSDLCRTADGRFLFVGLRDNSAQLWDVASGRPVLPASVRHQEAVTAVAISPDGRLLLTGSRDRSSQFWDAATGLAVGPRQKHASPVTRVAYSPSGNEMATGTANGLTVVWPVPPPPEVASSAELRSRFADLNGAMRIAVDGP